MFVTFPKMATNKNPLESNQENNNDTEYEVESIIGLSFVNNQPKFQVKWKISDETTEPMENLKNAHIAIIIIFQKSWIQIRTFF